MFRYILSTVTVAAFSASVLAAETDVSDTEQHLQTIEQRLQRLAR